MSTEVFSIKVSAEVKEKLKSLIESSGLQTKDFIEQMVKIYEINTSKEIFPQFTGDIEELHAITKRIYDIYLGIIERSGNLSKEKDVSSKTEIIEKKKLIFSLQEKLDLQNTEIESLQNEREGFLITVKERDEKIQEMIREIEETNKNNKEMAKSKEEMAKRYDYLFNKQSEYEQKNEELVKKSNLVKNENEKLKEEAMNIKKILLENDLAKKILESEFEKYKNQKELEIQQFKLEKEKEILELQKKKFEELQKKSKT